MSRAGIDANHAERCLGHVIGGVRGTYDRHAYYDEKKAAFEALAAQIDRIINPQEQCCFHQERRDSGLEPDKSGPPRASNTKTGLTHDMRLVMSQADFINTTGASEVGGGKTFPIPPTSPPNKSYWRSGSSARKRGRRSTD